MYVEVDQDRCNKLMFAFSDGVTTATTLTNTRGITALATRSWDITATQIECTSTTLPPTGCTQYFYGGTANYLIESYNWQASGTSVHLGSQHQRICIRRERGNCLGCFAAADALVQLSGDVGEEGNYSAVGGCCGYGTGWGSGILGEETTQSANIGITAAIEGANVFAYGYDCIIIPGAQGPAEGTGDPDTAQTTAELSQTLLATNLMPMPFPPQICGNGKSIGIGDATLAEAAKATVGVGTAINTATYTSAEDLTICTRNVPFTLEFMSDDLEGQGGEVAGNASERATAADNRGFQILHEQLACT
jgi:hypothetical protein